MFAILLAAAGLSACTDLRSNPVDLGKTDQAGHAYSLPMVQYQISMTRTLTECDGPELATIVSGSGRTDISVKMTYETDIEESFVADPDETYTVDYESLSSWTKTNSVELKNWENGALKSINASAKDKTGEIATKAIATAAQVAMTVSGVPTPGFTVSGSATKSSETGEDKRSKLAASIVDKIRVCKKSVRSALDSLAESKEELTARQNTVEGHKAALDVAKLDYATHPHPTAEMREDLEAAIANLREAREALATVIQKRQPFVARLSQVLGPKLWPTQVRSAKDPLAGQLADGQELADRWIGPIPDKDRDSWIDALSKLGTEDLKKLKAALEDPDRNDDPAALFAVDIALTPRTGDTSRAPSSGFRPSNGSELAGVYYRLSAPVRLSLTSRMPSKPNVQNLIAKHDGLAPQFGPRMVLPLSNGVMQSNSLKVSFNELGVPTDLTYSDDSARGSEAASILQQAATTLNAVREEMRQADLRDLQLQTEEAAQRGELFDAQQSLRTSRELADLKREKAQLQAKVAVLQSQLELTAAEATANRQMLENATADTVARTQLLAAQEAENEAQAALAASGQ